MLVRVDNGTLADPSKPMDRLQSSIKCDYKLASGGKKVDRKAAGDKMLEDLRS